jgi:hypothetical protein
VLIKDYVGWALLQQALSCVLPIRDLWGPANLVASMVAELDDTPLYFRDDIGIVFGPPTDYPSRFSRGRRHYGTVGPAQLFDSHRERWPLMLPSWLTCVMLPG